MRFKKALSIGSLGFLSFLTFTAHADLNITNNSNINTIVVKCSGKMPTVPITKGTTVSLDWAFVELIIGGLQGTCSFWNGVTHEADASILINPSKTSATIGSFVKYDQRLNVQFNPVIGVPSANITAAVTGG